VCTSHPNGAALHPFSWPRNQVELRVEPSRQRLLIAGDVLADDDAKPFAHLDPATDTITVNLLPARRESTASSGAGASSGGAGPVVIPRLDFGHITVETDRPLGTGSFKTVFRGSYGSHTIACLRFRDGEVDRAAAVREAAMMARLGRHPHVLRFFGAWLPSALFGTVACHICQDHRTWLSVGWVGGQGLLCLQVRKERSLAPIALRTENTLISALLMCTFSSRSQLYPYTLGAFFKHTHTHTHTHHLEHTRVHCCTSNNTIKSRHDS
jgi:hypothetical protein